MPRQTNQLRRRPPVTDQFGQAGASQPDRSTVLADSDPLIREIDQPGYIPPAKPTFLATTFGMSCNFENPIHVVRSLTEQPVPSGVRKEPLQSVP